MSRPLLYKKRLHPLVAQIKEKAAGMKLLTLAMDTGWSDSWLSAVFAGQRRPSIDGLTALAGALGYDIVLVKRAAKRRQDAITNGAAHDAERPSA